MTARREHGFALLVVLWTLPLLTLIGTQMTASSRFETRLAGNMRSAARAEAAADGAVRETIFRLSSGAWAADDRARTLHIGDASATIRTWDHAGRVNPNTASSALMTALLRQVGVAANQAASLTQAMQQWRMESSDLPAIAARYRAAGLTYGPTGKPFRSAAEIGLVLGMTPDILVALLPHVSVFQDADADPNLADATVVAALRGSETETDATRIGDPATRPLVAEIEAIAVDQAGGRFTRRAVVRIAAVDRSNPRPWRVLIWDAAV